MLLVSLVLGIVPLVGVALMFYQDPAITVDNLFVSLMLLGMSAIFLLNAAWELRQRLLARKAAPAKDPKSQPARALGAAAARTQTPIGVTKQRGIVREVQFFEAPVGAPNKSIVTLQLNGANSARVFAFEGDLRNALPIGKKVEISFRSVGDAYDLQEVNYV